MLDFFGYLFIYYYFFETEPSHNVGIFFFFKFFWKQSNAKLGDECQTGGIGKVGVF